MPLGLERGICGSLEWAASTALAPGERVCGDLHRLASDGSHTVVAVADGLGHGPAALAAAEAALEAIFSADGGPSARLEVCHRVVRGSRGAALGVGVISDRSGELCWAGVGNVEGAVVDLHQGERRQTRLFVQAGVVGHRMRRPREVRVTLLPGSLLVVATDGVDESFLEGVELLRPPADAAPALLESYAREHDDATLLVARYRGAA